MAEGDLIPATQPRTDLATLVGILGASLLIAFAIFSAPSANPSSFVDVPSIFIVIGGTFAVTLACFSAGELLQSQRLVVRTVIYPRPAPRSIAMQVLDFAEESRKNGILALQARLAEPGLHGTFSKAMQMVIDGIEPDAVERIVRQDIASKADRHDKGSAVLRKAAEVAPAMGLIGTLIGLVQMLGTLEDPAGIGPAMATALLTTLYGALLAYVVFSPLAAKLERNSQQETLIDMLSLKAAASIARKENPRRLQMVLNTLLPPAQRVAYFT